MSAAEDITSIFQEIISNNLAYCIVCLRTEKERKIIESESLMGCLGMLRMRAPTYKTLCFVCESSLTRALRFIHALHFAGAVNNWFRTVAGKLKYLDSMPGDLARVTQLMTFGKGKSLEQYWGELRARTELSQTEALLVNSHGFTHDVAEEPASPAPPEPPPHRDLELQNIVIVDDDDPLIPRQPPDPSHRSQPSLVPIEKLLDDPRSINLSLTPDQQQVITRDVNKPESFVLYPIVQGIDQVLYVPYLNGKIENGSFQYVDFDVIQQNVSQEHQLNTAPEFNFNVTNTNWEIISDCEVKVFAYDSVDDGGNGGGVTGDKEECGVVARQAVMSNARVDWEDKIPMDVISFVDATDPNAEHFVTPLSDPLSVPPASPTPPLAPPAPPPRAAAPPRPPGRPRARQRGVKKSRVDSDADVVIDLC